MKQLRALVVGVAALDVKDVPVFVLDHVKSNPTDTRMARSDYDACGKEASDSSRRFAWYANSVDQGHPDWSWLPFR
ncbi:MAG TPA: hypothetical protein VIK22_14095 [Candidatus Anoxymicrobiaceae bacterium]|jgi:hypothetical protein